MLKCKKIEMRDYQQVAKNKRDAHADLKEKAMLELNAL